VGWSSVSINHAMRKSIAEVERHTYFQLSVTLPKKKNSLKECVFVNSVLKIQCHIVKIIHSYRLLFRRFCPLG